MGNLENAPPAGAFSGKRFAVKEAAAKAFGTGIRNGWRLINLKYSMMSSANHGYGLG